VSGPYETEQQAHAASLWATHGKAQGMDMDAANMADLAAELSGIELGTYDRRIVEWLANWEPSTVAVICGLISRAHAAGQAQPGGPGQAQPGGGWISGPST
jgi:hypothetical protein